MSLSSRIVVGILGLFAVAGCGKSAVYESASTTSASAVPAKPRGAHRVVVEVSVDGPERWEGILNNVDNLRKSLGADKTEIEVVAHAKGLGMLLATNEALKERMKQLAEGSVVFAACENTMRKQGVTREQLVPFATTVDSGVAEVVRKQEAGWSYVKGGG